MSLLAAGNVDQPDICRACFEDPSIQFVALMHSSLASNTASVTFTGQGRAAVEPISFAYYAMLAGAKLSVLRGILRLTRESCTQDNQSIAYTAHASLNGFFVRIENSNIDQ